MTCPNRDGTAGSGGCIFCLNGSGAFAERKCSSIDAQMELAKSRVASKNQSQRYIAYFQSYTNTYAPLPYLEELFGEVIARPDVAVLDIATRPDCLGNDVIELLRKLNQIKPVWVELGLQTSNEDTARLIRRGYELPVYDDAVTRLHAAGIEVITHMIIGLPGENNADMERTVRHIASVGSEGIKLQLLHILRGTELERMYIEGLVRPLELEEYAQITASLIRLLPPEMIVHRITGDGAKDELVAPLWSLDKKRVLGTIMQKLTQPK